MSAASVWDKLGVSPYARNATFQPTGTVFDKLPLEKAPRQVKSKHQPPLHCSCHGLGISRGLTGSGERGSPTADRCLLTAASLDELRPQPSGTGDSKLPYLCDTATDQVSGNLK